MKKLFLLLAVAALGLAIWALQPFHNRKQDAPLTLYGNIDLRQVSLAFEGSGRIARVFAEDGDRVKAGEVLAVLDTRTLELQAAEARALAEVKRHNLLRLRNGSRPEEIEEARNRLTAAQAQAEEAERDLQRLMSISSSTSGYSVSEQDLDHTRSIAAVTRARVAELSSTLRLIELGPRQEEIDAAEAELKAAESYLALLEHQIAEGQLRAPCDAVIRSRLLESGDMAAPQKPVFALALTQPKWVRAYLDESDLTTVRPGMDAIVIADGLPESPVPGKVGYISSVAEFTPRFVQTENLRTSLVYEVRVLVEDPQDVLRLGQPVTVRLQAAPGQ